MERLELHEVSGSPGEVLDEVEVAVVGKRAALTLVLAAILAGGHVLLEDFPGLGKTLAARSFAQTLGSELRPRPVHARPAPVRPHRVVRLRPTHRASSRSVTDRCSPGLLLADEINRTPPRTQSALLEAMQERQITVEGQTFVLEPPVPRAGHGEPDRVRGHLSAPGGATRPVHDAHELRLPVGRRGVGRAAAAHGSAPGGADAAPDHRRADPARDAGSGRTGDRRRERRPVLRRPRHRDTDRTTTC